MESDLRIGSPLQPSNPVPIDLDSPTGALCSDKDVPDSILCAESNEGSALEYLPATDKEVLSLGSTDCF